MKLVIAAAALLLLGTFASAQESAYSSLVGMAESAATDRGPDPSEVPVSAPRRAPARPVAAEPVVAPVSRRASPVSSYRVEASTGALSAQTSLEVAASSAAAAGEIRGMAEYLAVSAAPPIRLPLRGR